MSSRPSAYDVMFLVPGTERFESFITTQNIWAGETVVSPMDAVRAAYEKMRRPYQCCLHDDLHKAGRIEPIPGYETQVILHPHFDLQVVRVEPKREGYYGGGMALYAYEGADRAAHTLETVSFRIRRDPFDAHCYDENGAVRYSPVAEAA